MIPAPTPLRPPQLTPSPEARATQAAAAWRQLWLRLATTTPRGLARALLVLSILAVLGWLVASAWSSLLPLQIGLVLAYATLPLVNWLDRWMPRGVAAGLVVLGELGLVALTVLLVVPPVVDEVATLIVAAPEALRAGRVTDLNLLIGSLPEPSRAFVNDALDQVGLKVRENLAVYLQRLVALAGAGLLTLFGTLGFVVSLLAVPTWLVSVLTDQHVGKRALDGVVPQSVRADFWAIVRIVDRPFSRYIRGQLFLGLIVAVAVYAGLSALDAVGSMNPRYRLALAVAAGIAQLVPTVGPVLGLIPALIVGLATSTEAALGILALYVGIQVLLAQVVVPRVERSSIDVHPALMVVMLAAVSQLGALWVVVAPPLIVAVRDVVRYVLGRLADPPSPAGRLPGEIVPRLDLAAARGRRRR